MPPLLHLLASLPQQGLGERECERIIIHIQINHGRDEGLLLSFCGLFIRAVTLAFPSSATVMAFMPSLLMATPFILELLEASLLAEGKQSHIPYRGQAISESWSCNTAAIDDIHRPIASQWRGLVAQNAGKCSSRRAEGQRNNQRTERQCSMTIGLGAHLSSWSFSFLRRSQTSARPSTLTVTPVFPSPSRVMPPVHGLDPCAAKARHNQLKATGRRKGRCHANSPMRLCPSSSEK